MSEAIFQHYDRAGLDAQLNLRARWPEHAEFFARWAEQSRAVRAERGCRFDLSYGSSPGERLDYFPAEKADAPLLAFVHGGYWQSLDKADFSYLAPAFLDRGIAFASINYDLAPKARIAEMVIQLRRALLWLREQASRLGFDPERIYLAGHSAGGHLVLTALGADWQGEYGLERSAVAGGLSLSGVYDLEPLRLSYHQPVLRLGAEEARSLSPLHHLPSRAAPLICAVGDQETDIFLAQQAALVEAWRARGLQVATVELLGHHHFSVVDCLADTSDPLHRALRDLIEGAS
jgi:arylformamidase